MEAVAAERAVPLLGLTAEPGLLPIQLGLPALQLVLAATLLAAAGDLGRGSMGLVVLGAVALAALSVLLGLRTQEEAVERKTIAVRPLVQVAQASSSSAIPCRLNRCAKCF